MEVLKPIGLSVLDAFRKRNQKELRKLDDVLLKKAAKDFSKSLLEFAVITYVLSKITSKPRFLAKERKKEITNVEDSLKSAVDLLDIGEEALIIAAFKKVENAIFALEKTDRRFMVDLVSKGKLKAAATLYAQGISLGLSSEMTGMEKQDILEYAGRTMMFDRVKEERTIMERVKSARRLIGG